MKRIVAFLLTLAAAFSIAACGKKKNKTTKKTGEITQSTDDKNNMIGNGNFSYGEVEVADSGDKLIKADNGGEWWLYGLEGGGGRMAITEDRQVEVGVVATAGKMHGVQFAYDGFGITKGSKYVFEFDVKCNIARQFEVRIQQNGGLYENYLMQGKKGNLIENATTEWKHFKYEFESYVTNAAPRLALNLGAFDGDPDVDPAKLAAGEPTFIFTFDNFKLVCTQDSGEVIDALNLDARPKICLNQVGYLPNQTKIAIFKCDDSAAMDIDYYIIDTTTGEMVKSGLNKIFGTNPASGEYVAIADFSDFTTPGKYRIEGVECGSSVEFEISDNVYTGITNDVIMMLYLQRCGLVEGETGDKFAHAACHQDDAKLYESPSTLIDVSGGWHDAGDYGKYVVPGAQTVADLLMTYEIMVEAGVADLFTYPSYVTTNDANIPDIVEEAMYELDWMLKMQIKSGAKAGQVYHKVTSKEFPSNQVKPQDDHSELYVSPVSYAATADFAAVMAMAYRVLNANGIAPDKALLYKNAAISAYAALDEMTKTSFKNPTDIKTGEYPDSELNDELAWASIELYAATGNEDYLTAFNSSFNKAYELGLGWANVNGFAALTAAKVVSKTSTTYQGIVDALITFANKLVFNAALDAYRTTIGEKTSTDESGRPYTEVVYEWGSNLTIASNGMVLNLALKYIDDASESVLNAFKKTAKEDEYLNTIKKYSIFANKITYVKTFDDLKELYVTLMDEQLNYLLGANACCYCFVTGYGYSDDKVSLTPEHPHHRPSIANEKAMKGMLVGGPDSNFEENGADSVATRSCQGHAPAHCYIDNDNSWSTNEVTIYWNSPLVYLLIAVQIAYPAA